MQRTAIILVKSVSHNAKYTKYPTAK